MRREAEETGLRRQKAGGGMEKVGGTWESKKVVEDGPVGLVIAVFAKLADISGRRPGTGGGRPSLREGRGARRGVWRRAQGTGHRAGAKCTRGYSGFCGWSACRGLRASRPYLYGSAATHGRPPLAQPAAPPSLARLLNTNCARCTCHAAQVADGSVPGIRAAAVRKLAHELGMEPAVLRPLLGDPRVCRFVARLHYCAADSDTWGPAAEWGEHEVDYILLLRPPPGEVERMGLQPNPEEVGVWVCGCVGMGGKGGLGLGLRGHSVLGAVVRSHCADCGKCGGL